MQEFQEYSPEVWAVKKDDICSAIDALNRSLVYIKEVKFELLERNTTITSVALKVLNKDLDFVERSLNKLRKLSG